VRSREMGIRAALGASRWRLIRGLLVEGVMLALAGAAIGIALAYAGVSVIRAWLPAGLPRVASIAIDLRVLGASVAAAVLTGVFFGIVPAFQSSRPDLTTTLKDSGRSASAGAGTHRLRSALVVAEVALAVMLLVGAGLFIGSFVKLIRIDPGFDHHNVLAVGVGYRARPGTPFEEALKPGQAYVTRMLEAVQHVPGVQVAGGVQGGLPLTGSWSRTSVTLPDRGELKGDDDQLDRRIVTPDYMKVLKIPLIRGRYLRDRDRVGGELVAVVNQAAARRFWPDRDALGQRFAVNKKERVVVGIVGDIHISDRRHLPGPRRTFPWRRIRRRA
jgi:predicted permease